MSSFDENGLELDHSPEIESNGAEYTENGENIGVDFQLIDTYFEDGPLGVTLRRRVEDGIVFVFDVVVDSQAVNLDVEVGDELWGVAQTEIGDTPLDKDAWNGLIQFIKQSPRPLRMIWRRYNSVSEHVETPHVEQQVQQHQESTRSPTHQESIRSPHTSSFMELEKIVNRLVCKDTNGKKSAASLKDFENLLKEGRTVLKTGDLTGPSTKSKTTLWSKGGQSKKHLVLLSDLLLICTPQSGNVFQVEEIIDLQTCKLRSNGQKFGGDSSGSSNPDLVFEVLFPGGAIELTAETAQSKEVWVLTIYLAICDCVGESERVLGWRHQYMLGTMHSAVLSRDENRVRELVALCEAGQMEFSVIEAQDADGYTPLHYAIMLRIHSIVRILHEASADVTATDNYGLSCLHWAALKLDDYSLPLLCAHVFDVDLLDAQDRTPLYLACVEGRDATGKTDPIALKKCVTTLLTHQPNVSQSDRYGITLLHSLAASWQYEAMELLLEAGAEAQCGENQFLMTPLHYAATATPIKRAVGEATKIINRMTLNNSDDPALTATEEINRQQGANTLRALLRAGGRPNNKDRLGRAALHIIAEPDREIQWGAQELSEAVSVLISFGARMDDTQLLTGLRSRFPDINYAALAEKWASLPVINGDKLNVAISQFGGDGDAHSPSVDRSAKDNAAAINTGSNSSGCALCSFQFTMFKRQHHCRLCGQVCCDECSKKRVVIEGAPTRTCDSCYNRVLHLQEQAVQKELLASIKPLPRSTAAATGRTTSQDNEGTKKEQLFGTSSTGNSNTSSTAGDSRAKRLEGSNRQASGGMNATMNTLSETHERLQERGEKLSKLSDRTEEMSNQASEFAKMARQLKEQQQNRWF